MPINETSEQQSSELTYPTVQVLQRLIKAHLSLIDAQRYIKQRFQKKLGPVTSKHIFEYLDRDRKGWVSVFDIEKFLIKYSTRAFVQDIELLVELYGHNGKILEFNF